MKLKRVLAILLALCMILPLAACGGDKGGTTTTVADTTTTTANGDVDPVDPVDPDVDVTTDPNATTTTVTNKDGSVVTTTTVKGPAATTTRTKKKGNISLQTLPQGQAGLGQITIKEGTKKITDGLDFGGKTITFLQNGTPNPESDYGKTITAFGKEYNAKMEVSGAPYADYVTSLAAAVAGGQVYDIVFSVGAWYPQEMLRNLMTPLDGVFTTADLWDDKSMTTGGGLSKSLSEALSLYGKTYVVGGPYMASPGVMFYNKKILEAAGYDGNDDPLALYNKGKWNWEKIYDILADVQDPSKGLYGLNSISPYYFRMILPSYGTDIAVKTRDSIKGNLSDPQLYKCMEMLQKMNHGEHSVCNPKDQYENGYDQFLNGTTAMLMSYSGQIAMLYNKMETKVYSAFGTKDSQMANIGMVPLPAQNSKGVHAIWDWMGYGSGNGSDLDGQKAAIAWAMYESVYNQKQVWDERMPANYKNMMIKIVDSDKLAGPLWGFSSSAGSLSSIQGSIARRIANEGESIAVVLKGHEKLLDTVIKQALTV